MKRFIVLLLFLLSPLTASAAACSATNVATAYYSFDADSSADNSGNGNNGTDANMAYGASYGKILHGALFNGTSSKIAVPSNVYSLFNGTASWSINLWGYWTGGGKLFTAYTGTTNTCANASMFITLDSDGYVRFSRGNGSACDQGNSTSAFASASTYYMITLTYDGSNIQLYTSGTTNGSPVASSISGVTASGGSIGTYIPTTGGWFGGQMDEIGLYPCTLTSAQVTSLYNSGMGLNPYAGGTTAVMSILAAILQWRIF